MEYIRVTKDNLRIIWKRNTFAALFPTIRMYRCLQRKHGWLTGLMKVLFF